METTNEPTNNNIAVLNWIDIVVIVAYFVFVMLVGVWASFQSSRATLKGYFLAGKNMLWWPIGASLFSSNIGSGHFIGLAGSGAAGGIAVGAFEFNAMFILLLLGWIFLPVYMSAGVYTMPEYLRKRFGGQRVRVYLAVLALILSIVTKISVDLFAGALFVQQSLGWDLYLSIIILLAITAVYTVVGGLSAVIYTDALQTAIMLIGALVLMILCFIEVPYNELYIAYFQAIPNTTLNNPNATCGYPREDAFHIFRDPLTADLPWPGMIFGITISSIWYWCTDQVIVQRALAAKTLSHAKGGCVMAAFLKVLPMFIIVFPGMVSRTLYPNEVACADPAECLRICQSETACTNVAYPKLVVNIMPTGARGLMLAVIMSALMSSLTSIFNSSSTIFTIDIWRRIRPNSSETELMIVGRIFILIMVGISILWIPIIQASQGGRLFDYIQAVTSYLAPPICAVFLMAIIWERVNEKGAFWGLMAGLVVGLVRMILDFAFPSPACGDEDDRPAVIANMHYLYFGMFLFVFVCLFTAAVSLLTTPIPSKYLVHLTWATRHSTLERQDLSISEVQELKEKVLDEPEDEEEEVKFSRKVIDWMCGTGKQPEMTAEQEAEQLARMTNIEETKRDKMILNISAILAMGVSVFFWAYYG
ncbi:sodium/glucose cotransporter 4 isoform X1 [Strongylocentrotus purpuratus]|uniref:Sodium/glucose cotransporter 4 n=1 Tax=Strongylocentrotus purpuratus TaxID=7668 RepID=A0A7M7P9D1_STRPU|nr:sodium/glucose cotransporter 4 isoform X1 [Strongylocentrotus purpuratus]